MKKKLGIVLLVFSCMNMQAETYRIEMITSTDLSAEYQIFQAFRSSFAHESLEVIKHSFAQEEQDYAQKLEKRMFFHAFLGDRMIGYISCDVRSNSLVVVRQWAVDPEMVDGAVIKDLLFAVLAKRRSIQALRINCPAQSSELISFFQDLGFVQIEHASDAKNIEFEFKRSFKCKLCELLYPNVWEVKKTDEDEDEDESEPIIPDAVDYN